MSEFVTVMVERRWIDDDSGDTVRFREAERDFGAAQIDSIHDELLAVVVRDLLKRTEVEAE